MEPKDSTIKVEYGTEVTLVTFDDENILEDQQIKELEQALRPVIERNAEKQLVLNFDNVRFMSSAFLGLLVKSHKRVIDNGGRLQLHLSGRLPDQPDGNETRGLPRYGFRAFRSAADPDLRRAHLPAGADVLSGLRCHRQPSGIFPVQ